MLNGSCLLDLVVLCVQSQETLRYAFTVAQRPTKQGKVKMQEAVMPDAVPSPGHLEGLNSKVRVDSDRQRGSRAGRGVGVPAGLMVEDEPYSY